MFSFNKYQVVMNFNKQDLSGIWKKSWYRKVNVLAIYTYADWITLSLSCLFYLKIHKMMEKGIYN